LNAGWGGRYSTSPMVVDDVGANVDDFGGLSVSGLV